MKRSVSVASALLGVALAAACSDDTPPTQPELPVRADQEIVAAPELGGLFFFGPPVGAVGDRAAPFDASQLPVVVFEICLQSGLENGGDALDAACPDPLGRWDSNGGPGRRAIFVEGDDWYQVDVSFAAFDRAELELGETYVGRVLVGDPSGTPGVDFQVYGAFDFELVGNRGRGGPPGAGPPTSAGSRRGPPPGAGPGGGNVDDEPRQVVSVQTVPVKWFLGEGAAAELLCETGECTTKVIEAEEGGELCYPEGDCEDPQVRAGTRVQRDALPHDILLTIEEIDLTEEPNPLGIPNPQIGRAVRITATPPFEDLESFDTNDIGGSDIIVQGCFEVPAGVDPDDYAIFRGTDQGAERLPVNPLQSVFDTDNCPTPPGGVALGDGLLDRARLALRDRVLRPVAGLLGPRPLRAGDKSFTADSRGFSPFVPALSLDLLPNETPPDALSPGAQVAISVCVEGFHPGSDADPRPEAGVEVSFEVVTADGGVVSDGVVSAQLEDASGAECDTPANEDGEVAVARTLWTLPEDPGTYTARGFLDGDYVLSVQQNGSYALEDVEFEVLFETEVADPLIACGPYPVNGGGGDLFDLRGIYIPSYGGTTLDRVDLFLSSGRESGGVAGTYEVRLTARDGAFDGPVLGTATATVFLDGTDDQNLRTVFDFGGVATTSGSTVAFEGEVVSAPQNGEVLFNVPSAGDQSCPVVETNGTNEAIGQDDRRQGVAIRVFGETPPPIE